MVAAFDCLGARMRMVQRLFIGVAVAIGAFSAAARADDAMPAERTQGSVTYVSGGIGKDESTALKQAASRYSLSIEMASTAGPRAEYVSDVKIDIRDQKGVAVLNVTSDGPFLLANLPPGRYMVSAARNGSSQQRAIVIAPGAHQRVMFSFKE